MQRDLFTLRHPIQYPLTHPFTATGSAAQFLRAADVVATPAALITA